MSFEDTMRSVGTSVIDAVRTVVVEKYADFGGRARRSELWWFVLAYMLLRIVILVLERATGNPFIALLMSLGLFLPSLGVGVRRLHDIGRSGWWVLISLIPVVGWIVLVVFYVQDSQPGTNQYGPNPKFATRPAPGHAPLT